MQILTLYIHTLWNLTKSYNVRISIKPRLFSDLICDFIASIVWCVLDYIMIYSLFLGWYVLISELISLVW